MDQILGRTELNSESNRVNRAVRTVLVIYLSPILLLVMAIGAVGMLTSRLASLGARSPGSHETIAHVNHFHISPAKQARRIRSSI